MFKNRGRIDYLNISVVCMLCFTIILCLLISSCTIFKQDQNKVQAKILSQRATLRQGYFHTVYTVKCPQAHMSNTEIKVDYYGAPIRVNDPAFQHSEFIKTCNESDNGEHDKDK